jgi:hypothetical protein
MYYLSYFPANHAFHFFSDNRAIAHRTLLIRKRIIDYRPFPGLCQNPIAIVAAVLPFVSSS